MANSPTTVFGTSVSMTADGAALVVGAPRNDGQKDNSGRVYTFVYDTLMQTYKRDETNVLDGMATNDVFGFSVSISGDGKTLLVGAPGSDAGRVCVFQRMVEPTLFSDQSNINGSSESTH